tara:strand:- start:2310 stop:2984 length:675 start_codon:yes stop_codon:yes gene_type:complete
MSGLKVITAPSVQPVSRIEAREHLRLDDDVDDSQIRSFIKAATDWAENYTGRFFISRTCQMMLDGASQIDAPLSEGQSTGHYSRPISNYIEIAAAPVTVVSSIKYYADDDTQSVWSTSNYYVDTFSDQAKIVLRSGGTYPTDLRAANGLEINFTAGYGETSSSVPEVIRLAILQYITFLYEHRGDFERFPAPTPPAILRTLLNPYRIIRFGVSPYSSVINSGSI